MEFNNIVISKLFKIESTLKSPFATNYTNYTNLTCYYSAVYKTINTTNYQKHRFWSGLKIIYYLYSYYAQIFPFSSHKKSFQHLIRLYEIKVLYLDNNKLDTKPNGVYNYQKSKK